MAKKLPTINDNEFTHVITALEDDRKLRQSLDKQSREAGKRIGVNRALLLQAMGRHDVVQCGRRLLTLKPGKATPGAATLVDDGKIPLSRVQGICVDGALIAMAEIKTWFAGRTAGPDIEISEAV